MVAAFRFQIEDANCLWIWPIPSNAFCVSWSALFCIYRYSTRYKRISNLYPRQSEVSLTARTNTRWQFVHGLRLSLLVHLGLLLQVGRVMTGVGFMMGDGSLKAIVRLQSNQDRKEPQQSREKCSLAGSSF